MNKETKEALFAAYYGCDVIVTKGTYTRPVGNIYKLRHDVLETLSINTKVKLAVLLKSLSAISDEDLFAATGSTNGIDNHVDYFFGGDIDRMLINLGSFECDILRSLGYAAPFRGISVEEQIKSGAIKLIEQ